MAELVPLDRSGDWRRRQREREELAVGFRAARPALNAVRWRGNRSEPMRRSVVDVDLDLIDKLEESGKISPEELLTYQTPPVLLHQGGKIDPANVNITSIVNDMARGRRVLLHLALKEKSGTAEAEKISDEVFAQWPAKIQTIQGEVAAAKSRHIKPRYVRIPPLLVTDISLN